MGISSSLGADATMAPCGSTGLPDMHGPRSIIVPGILKLQHGHRWWTSLNHKWRVPNDSVLSFCVIAIIQGKEMLISFIYSSVYFHRLVQKL